MEDLIKRLSSLFNIKETKRQRENFYIVEIDKDDVLPVLSHLKDNENFKHLALLSCVDWLEDNKFQLSYILWNYKDKKQLLVKLYIDRENPDFITVHHLWPHALHYEREIHEMYGVNFEGNPRQDEEMILEDWDGMPPMRRDFDTLKYATEHYGFRWDREEKTIREIISEITDEWREK